MVVKNIKSSKVRFCEGKVFSYLILSTFLSDYRFKLLLEWVSIVKFLNTIG